MRSVFRCALAMTICFMLASVRFSPIFASEESDEQIVKTFFPQKLVEASLADHARGGPPPRQHIAFKRADLDRSGHADYIVAAYTNTLDSAVRVIKTSDSGDTLAAEMIDPAVGGIYPDLELSDLDHDGVPEIIAKFSTHSGRNVVWIFKWLNGSLTLLSPTERDKDGVLYTLFVDPDFLDIDGDGVQEAILTETKDKWSPPSSASIYKLSGGVYGLVKQCSYFTVIERSTAAPEWVEESFGAEPNSTCSLTIQNGFPNGASRVSSATIEVNGVVVAEPSDFSQTTDQIQRQVKAVEENKVRVKLDAAPGGRVFITAECAPPNAPAKRDATAKQ